MWQLLSFAFPKSSTLASLLTLIAVPPNPISGSQVQFLQPAPCSNHWTLKTGIDGLRRNNCLSPVVRWGHCTTLHMEYEHQSDWCGKQKSWERRKFLKGNTPEKLDKSGFAWPGLLGLQWCLPSWVIPQFLPQHLQRWIQGANPEWH